MTTKIEWCEKDGKPGEVWNPVTGCTRVSAGCDNCYAVGMTRRLAGMGLEKYRGLVDDGKKHFNGTVRCHKEVLDLPLNWKKPRVVFVNSMSDLFHESVPFEFIYKVYNSMCGAFWHTYIILTKRPGRAHEFYAWLGRTNSDGQRVRELQLNHEWPPKNVWLGVSVEDQATADERIPWLLQCPAAVRLLSMEPLLGAIDIKLCESWCPRCRTIRVNHVDTHDGETSGFICNKCNTRCANCVWEYLSWVIVGGESGPGARPMHPDWARAIRDQCQAAGVPFSFKQWGAWNVAGRRVGKKWAGRILDGRTWNERPVAVG